MIVAGDSIPERRDWSRFGPVLNLAKGGDTTATLRARFSQVLAFAPLPIHLMIGTNNCTPDSVVPAAIADILYMASAARSAGSTVILSKIPPRAFNVATFNDALVTMATAEGFNAPVDYWATMMAAGNMNFALFNSDYCHPNAAGYAMMDCVLLQRLDALGIWHP